MKISQITVDHPLTFLLESQATIVIESDTTLADRPGRARHPDCRVAPWPARRRFRPRPYNAGPAQRVAVLTNEVLPVRLPAATSATNPGDSNRTGGVVAFLHIGPNEIFIENGRVHVRG
jgi:hypothetical protein